MDPRMERNPEQQLPNSRRESVTSLQDFSDILDLSNLDLDNQETWLYEPQCVSSGSAKCINTATFTRPKRRYVRASINDLEQIYHSAGESSNLTTCLEEKQGFNNNIPQTVKEEPESMPNQEAVMPLQFDLHQPISLHNFDSFMLSSQMSSFQNMSPPSLVNSLCSSTFSSLMENSVIKNDPILREIRDKDFMEYSLLQDIDPPMFQSMSESCTIYNTDTPEAFLECVSQNCTLKNGSFADNNATFVNQEGANESSGSRKDCNATYEIGGADVKNATFSMDPVPVKHEATHRNVLDTTSSVRHIKHSATFRKSDLKNRTGLNVTRDVVPTDNRDMDRNLTHSIENDLNNSNKEIGQNVNTTITKPNGLVIQRSDSIELLKRRSSSDGSMDLNTPSQERIELPNSTFVKDDVPAEMNRSTPINRMSTGSAESLDRLSSLSSSSKSSNRMQSFEDIQDIDERFTQRRLSRVMSTPVVLKGKPSLNLGGGCFVSPIVANAKYPSSDSELSDEYKSVTSQPSSNVSMESWSAPRNTTTTVNADRAKTKPSQRGVYTMPSIKPALYMPNNIPGSGVNMKTLKNTANTAAGLAGSNQNLHKFGGKMEQPPTTYSNLKTMNTKLKGSYTSLRPISANLPVAPPPLNGTHTITRPGRNADPNTIKTVVKSATSTHIRPSTYAPKPDQPRASGLPRPTGIPRPTSRIPGPRSGR